MTVKNFALYGGPEGTFFNWLKWWRHESSPRGDLARDAWEDERTGCLDAELRTHDEWAAHLRMHEERSAMGLAPGALDTFEEAWAEWVAYRRKSGLETE